MKGTVMRNTVIPFSILAIVLLGSCSWSSISGTAIVLGVSDYGIPGLNLNYCDDDAEDVAALFAAQGYTVHKFVDTQATRENLELAIHEADATKPVIVYYSGHGIDPLTTPQDITKNFYILPFGSITLSGSTIEYHSEKMISLADIQKVVDEHSIIHCILILDACFSGGFVTNLRGASAIPEDYDPILTEGLISYAAMADTAAQKFFTYSGNITLTVIAASGSLEESFESSAYENGVFTEFFVDSVTGPQSDADRDGDGYITTSEVYLYVARCLNLWWNSTLQAQANTEQIYLPHISDNPREYILFKINK